MGLATLLSVACSPPKPVESPAAIPEIKLEEIILEPETQRKDEGKEEQVSRFWGVFYLSEQCDPVELERGYYPIKIGKILAEYEANVGRSGLITYGNCRLLISPKQDCSRFDITINDDGCDNTVDRLTYNNNLGDGILGFDIERQELEEPDKKRLDHLLEEAQQFVCLKNKKRVENYLLHKIFGDK